MLKQDEYRNIVFRYFQENNVSRMSVMVLVLQVFHDRYVQYGRSINSPELWEQGIKEGLIEYANKSLQTIYAELVDYNTDESAVTPQEIINFQNSVADMPEFEGVAEAQRTTELTRTSLRTIIEELRNELIEELETIKTDGGAIQDMHARPTEGIIRRLRQDEQHELERLAGELDIDLDVFNQDIEYKVFNKLTETQGEVKMRLTINSKSMRAVRKIITDFWKTKILTAWTYNDNGQFIQQSQEDITRGGFHNEFSHYLKRIFQRNNKSEMFSILPISTIILTWDTSTMTIENAQHINEEFEEEESYIEAIKRMAPWNQEAVLNLPFLTVTWSAGNIGRWQEDRWPYLQIVEILNDAILEYTTGFETMFLEYFGDEPNE